MTYQLIALSYDPQSYQTYIEHNDEGNYAHLGPFLLLVPTDALNQYHRNKLIWLKKLNDNGQTYIEPEFFRGKPYMCDNKLTNTTFEQEMYRSLAKDIIDWTYMYPLRYNQQHLGRVEGYYRFHML